MNNNNTASSVVQNYKISFEFSLHDQNGRFIDDNVGKEAMTFQTNANEMLPALEKELYTLNQGESKRVILLAGNAYGPIQQSKFRVFPLAAIPQETRRIGRKVMAVAPSGKEELVDVVDIVGDKVTLDFNHALAGKNLHFNVKLLKKTII